MHRILPPILAALLAALAISAPADAAACAGANAVPGRHNSAAVRRAVLCLLNQERRRHRLPVLRLSGRLGAAAGRHSHAMVAGHFFDHNSPRGTTMASRLRSAGYRFRAAGENIAWGSGSLATPTQIVREWMHSAGHRQNILRPAYREVGVGVAAGTPRGAHGGTYTTDFAVRL